MELRAVCTRVKNSLADPMIRWKVAALLGGKMIGLALVLCAMKIFIAPAVYAADGPTPEINALNTVWVLIAAFLVFCMQVGFVMLEAGFARSRESINILVEGIVDTAICGVTFWAWGFAFMFMDGTPFVGTHGFISPGPAGHVPDHRRAAPRVLGLPVRVRRHLLDDHVRRHGRPLRLYR
jgi:Amt family ammonium transporter